MTTLLQVGLGFAVYAAIAHPLICWATTRGLPWREKAPDRARRHANAVRVVVADTSVIGGRRVPAMREVTKGWWAWCERPLTMAQARASDASRSEA